MTQKKKQTERRVLEQGRRLSQSMLWELQRAYFERQGISAWSAGVVPHYVTSNAYIGRAYAQVVQAFLDGWRAAPGGRATIVELGAGSGRFTHHFLKAFVPRVEPELPFTYVVTDFAESTLAVLAAHPDLKPFVEAGVLDFARFDASLPGPLVLGHSGAVLEPGAQTGPVAVIANYVFDSIPADCFMVRDGALYELLASVTTDDPEVGPTDRDALEQVDVRYRRRKVTHSPYEDPLLDRILEDYRQSIGEGTFLFPVSALECLDWFEQVSGGRLLVVSADKGYARLEELEGRENPWLAHHGSISVMVNYHALGEWARLRGGTVLHPGGRPSHLTVVAYALGDPPAGAGGIRRAYLDALDEGGPDDFFSLKKALEQHYGSLSVEAILALIRLSGYDASVFYGCSDTLLLRASSDSEQREDLRAAAWAVWDRYFPIGERNDLAFTIGRLLYRLAYYDEAAGFFRRSTELCGPDPATAYNEALCEQELGNLERARELVAASLALDPEFAESLTLREELGERSAVTS